MGMKNNMWEGLENGDWNEMIVGGVINDDETIKKYEDEIKKQKVIEDGARDRIEFLEKSIKEITDKKEK